MDFDFFFDSAKSSSRFTLQDIFEHAEHILLYFPNPPFLSFFSCCSAANGGVAVAEGGALFLL